MTTLTFGSSQAFTIEPLVMLTIVGSGHSKDIHVTCVVDTGAGQCVIPDSFIARAGYALTNLPTVQFGTAGGAVTATAVDIDLYAFGGTWTNHPVMATSGGPALIGRSLLDLALDAVGYEGPAKLLHHEP
jgi:hypothetical protein